MTTATLTLTDEEARALAEAATQSGQSPEQLLREALHEVLDRHALARRRQLLEQGFGIWKDRDDLPSWPALRAEWDRH